MNKKIKKNIENKREYEKINININNKPVGSSFIYDGNITINNRHFSFILEVKSYQESNFYSIEWKTDEPLNLLDIENAVISNFQKSIKI